MHDIVENGFQMCAYWGFRFDSYVTFCFLLYALIGFNELFLGPEKIQGRSTVIA